MKKLALLMTLLVSACGTTSSLRNAQAPSALSNFTKYNKVIVNDFTDGVTETHNDPNIIKQGKLFADLIASKITEKNCFASVARNKISKEKGVLISGEITQHEEGSAAKRALLGFGAGRSHFDADVYFKDNTTKNLLGDIKVDKASWALGGLLAGNQDVKSHMLSAATKISEEVCTAKTDSE